jgi:tRNA(fMet)-specific endonuclease VapC
MMFMLDTDVLIFMIRALRSSGRNSKTTAQGQQLAARCREMQATGHAVGLSAITVSELEFGAMAGDDPKTSLHAIRKVLTPFDLFDYDAVHCPAHYGRLRAQLEADGLPIGSMDMLIAAHAIALGATLVTNNTRHFARAAGLAVENWLLAS